MTPSVSGSLPAGTRPAAWYPNRSGLTDDGLEAPFTPARVPRPRLVRHPDHVCPDGTRITGISAQHLAGNVYRGGITLWRGHYADPDEHGAYPPVHFPLRFGDHRRTAPDTAELDQQHRHNPGRAAA